MKTSASRRSSRHAERAAKGRRGPGPGQAQAAGTRGRGEDPLVKAVAVGVEPGEGEASDLPAIAKERWTRPSLARKSTTRVTPWPEDQRDELRRTQDRVKKKEQFLEDEDQSGREVEDACQNSGQGFREQGRNEVHATICGRGGAAARTRRGSRPGGSAPEAAPSTADDSTIWADVSALRRQRADTVAAISQLEGQRTGQEKPGHCCTSRTSLLLGELRRRAVVWNAPR